MFEGKRITSVRKDSMKGNTVYKIAYTGGIMTVWNEKDIKALDHAKKQAKRLEVNETEYIQYLIDEEGIIS